MRKCLIKWTQLYQYTRYFQPQSTWHSPWPQALMTLVIRFLRQKALPFRGPFPWMNHQNKYNIIPIRQRFIFHSALLDPEWTTALVTVLSSFFGIPRVGRTRVASNHFDTPVRTCLRLYYHGSQKPSHCVSNLTCSWHFVRARLHLGQWDSFSVAHGRKLTFLPSKRGPGSADLLPEWERPHSTIIYWAPIIREELSGIRCIL